MSDEHLTHGWEPDLDAGDSFVRRFVLASADRAELFARSVGGRVLRDGEVASVDPASSVFFDNATVLLQPPEYIDFEAAVDRVLAFYPPDRHFVLLAAFPTPDLTPKGFSLMGHPPLMIRPAGGGSPPLPAGLEIREVTDTSGLREFVDTLVEAYPMPTGHGSPLAEPAVLGQSIHLYTGYVDGRPVATGGASLERGIVNVEFISTRADYRGKGIGAAVTWAATLADPSLPAMLIASDDGQAVYERMGYLRLVPAHDVASAAGVNVHLIDGTYELFRFHFSPGNRDPKFGATKGVVGSVLQLLESGATHVGVATDHVIESFRNDLWPGYKTSAGMPRELLAQFPVVEEALMAAGVATFPMVELEADDALASLAKFSAADDEVDEVIICTPDKDLGQCVGGKVVQLDRRQNKRFDVAGVREKFGVEPASIPDYLALVGDTADGFPGLPGWGSKSAAAVLARYGHVEDVPADGADWDVDVRNGRGLAATLQRDLALALLFRRIATVESDAPLIDRVDDLRWTAPHAEFFAVCERLDGLGLAERAAKLAAARRPTPTDGEGGGPHRTPPAGGGIPHGAAAWPGVLPANPLHGRRS